MKTARVNRRRLLPPWWFTITAGAMLLSLAACRSLDKPDTYLLPGDQMQDYVDQVTAINYPQVDQPVDDRAMNAAEPRRLGREHEEEIWDVTLAEAIQVALGNSRVIRNAGQFLSPGNPILNNPDFTTTVFDPAIQESGVLFGQRGVEAALSEFDTQFVTQMVWGHTESIQNNAFTSGGLAPGTTLINETANFNSSLQKRLGTGGQVALSHAWNYTDTNVPAALFPSVYEGNLRAEFRQPILAGGGAEYTRIAGPVSTNIQGVTGVQQGVIIARINNDIALADFERSVSQLIHDVESLYWQLHLAYRAFDVQSQTREASLKLWQVADGLRRAGSGNGGATSELSIREAELQLEGQVDQARDQIYSVEAQLRLLMGLPVNDGRIIRPIDNPITARFEPDWNTCLSEALMRRPEIRRQKWSIKSLELQLRAADNLTMPRFDLVAAYQVNGFGDNLAGGTTTTTPNGRNLGSAYSRLIDGNEAGWNLGCEFSMPLGRRFAYAQQHSLELRLAKSKELLGAQEVEISHEVASIFRDLDRNYLATENALSRLTAGRERLKIAELQHRNDPDRYPLDSILRAQEAVGQAELQFLNGLIQYNNSINDLHLRTGRTLTANSILLSEGAWTPEAYKEADNNYRRRAHAWENPWLEQDTALWGTTTLSPTIIETVYEPATPTDQPVSPTTADVQHLPPSPNFDSSPPPLP